MTDKRKPPPPAPSGNHKAAADGLAPQTPPAEPSVVIAPVTEKIAEPRGNLQARERAMKRRRGQ